MSKKKHDPVKALMDAFEEQVNDLELQERYDRFKSSRDYARDEHNKLVLQINANISDLKILESCILEQAKLGIIATEAITKVKEIEEVNDGLIHRLEGFRATMDENGDLIKKYDDMTQDRLFVWWQAIKAVEPETKPWLEFKQLYRDKHI